MSAFSLLNSISNEPGFRGLTGTSEQTAATPGYLTTAQFGDRMARIDQRASLDDAHPSAAQLTLGGMFTALAW
ncbi:MAG: hypothetical protein VX589_19805 [Myxococcota bacterium]|nr:hypothetical protein [Myxococcota bacterium]